MRLLLRLLEQMPAVADYACTCRNISVAHGLAGALYYVCTCRIFFIYVVVVTPGLAGMFHIMFGPAEIFS